MKSHKVDDLIVDRETGIQAAQKYLAEKEQECKNRRKVQTLAGMLSMGALGFGAGTLLWLRKKPFD